MTPQAQREKIAVIGATGWVGKSMLELFPNAYMYSRHLGDQDEVNRRSVAFLCVPSPETAEGKLDTHIVEDIIAWCECPLIVIRSTVNPGDCDRWSQKYKRRIVHQPEFLGETPNHPLLNPLNTPFIILGGKQHNTREVIELYATVYNANVKIRQVSLLESEVIKLSENRAIAYKVMQMHELYKVCEKAGLDYYTIRDAVYGDDPRFDLWFTFIYPEKLGFENSKCLKKDVPAWCAWAESIGADPQVTKALVKASKEYASL